MKKKLQYGIVIVTVAILSATGCSLFPDEDNKCLKDNWDTPEEPIIFIRLTSQVTTFQSDFVTYDLSMASSIAVSGTIHKIYCTGKLSGMFEFDSNLYPSSGAIPLVNVRVGGPFQYKFQNDEDHVSVSLTLKATFPDGKVFESVRQGNDFYYNNIKFQANDLEYYVLLVTSPNMTFTKVSG